jgi:hypothetical protein
LSKASLLTGVSSTSAATIRFNAPVLADTPGPAQCIEHVPTLDAFYQPICRKHLDAAAKVMEDLPDLVGLGKGLMMLLKIPSFTASRGGDLRW